MSSRKPKPHEWPIYQFSEHAGLLAFLGPCDCYQVINKGKNSGLEGVSVNHYITRRSVFNLLHDNDRDIHEDEFRERYNRLFAGISIKITGR